MPYKGKGGSSASRPTPPMGPSGKTSSNKLPFRPSDKPQTSNGGYIQSPGIAHCDENSKGTGKGYTVDAESV